MSVIYKCPTLIFGPHEFSQQACKESYLHFTSLYGFPVHVQSNNSKEMQG